MPVGSGAKLAQKGPLHKTTLNKPSPKSPERGDWIGSTLNNAPSMRSDWYKVQAKVDLW